MSAVKREASEFHFTDKDFEYLRGLIYDHAGISMAESKRDLVYGRLARRLRALGLTRFSEYIEFLESNLDHEAEHFVNALTTNLTAFFRENHHFEFLKNEFLPGLIRSKREKRLRIWSAGCSTGEEPYSIAMVLAEVMPSDWDVRVLATDLDTSVVERGRTGIYPAERVASIPNGRLKRWFRKGRGAHAGQVQVVPAVRELIVFKPLNLMHPWPMKGRFDAIFCRNVVIYFDKDTQSRLFARFEERLEDHGRLFVGHSESLFKVTDRFRLIGNTVYEKAGAA